MSEAEFRETYRGTPVLRTKRAGLARNAAIALGNSRQRAAEAPLSRALLTHTSELVRAHAAWALAALGLTLGEGLAALAHAQEHDESAGVRAEAGKSLAAVAARDGGMTAPESPKAR
jgi:epoxyqueuosine reductase